MFQWLKRRKPSQTEMRRERECRDLVLRSRAGDQVAMALIVEIRKNAEKGDASALDSYRRIDRFTKRSKPMQF